MIGFSGPKSDGVCELNQVNGVLPVTAWPRQLICTASLYRSS